MNAHRTVKFETVDDVRYFTVTKVLRTDITDAWYARITANDGKRLILSTCCGLGKDGRLLIIAAETQMLKGKYYAQKKTESIDAGTNRGYPHQGLLRLTI